ncbi:MAG: tRNA (N(6)-L-threonylcarbamoyladenosine(37)-C(2))-methylthiotransferase MtaB [Clostridia bacterium]|nr:tRNA (N(6)-L-threonylcarbamoyladenosine(37)-C(2))-methylthiotransferase MtaB [Clostridia bacterium]
MKVKFITLGCKTNFYESQALAEMFKKRGYQVVRSGIADVCVINTCAVTSMGAQKSRQQIHRAKKQNPNAVIAVMGCYAQTDAEKLKESLDIDVLIGTSGRGALIGLVEEALKGKRMIAHTDIMKERDFEELCLTSDQSRIRATVKIEDGCANFCAYCIIPYARGPVRSRSLEKIIEEVKLLAQNGFAEVVLTGIHIGSYGRDLKNGLSLIDVMEAVCSVEGIKRVRLGSVEPVVITEDFVNRAQKLKNLCPQFHLSLQSGSTKTLMRMKRRYTAEEYMQAVERLRVSIPDTSITTDIMVGFPGETDEEFKESYNFCKAVGFMQMHIFKYSKRPGTVAAGMPHQVPEQIKEERSQKLIALEAEMKKTFYDSYKGKTVEVLAEIRTKDGRFHATTPNYMDVFIESDQDITGKFVTYTFKD